MKKTNELSSGILIGFAGEIASGKTTAARYIESNYNFHYVRYSQILQGLLNNYKDSVSRQSLQEFGLMIFKEMGGKGLTDKLLKRIVGQKKVVVDGIRHLSDVDTLRNDISRKTCIVYIGSEYHIRNERYCAKNSNGIDYDKALTHEVESEILLIDKSSDFIISNNSTFGELYKNLDEVVKTLIKL